MNEETGVLITIDMVNCRDALKKVIGCDPSEEQTASFLRFVAGHLDSCLENLAASFASTERDVGYG